MALFVSATPGETGNGSGGPVGRAPAFLIHLELERDDRAVAMHPGHVFAPGDVLRFRVTARDAEGYLYVIDQGTSGAYTMLFPARGGRANPILHRDQEVSVPSAGDGWFEVGGPAGFDRVYFLVSPRPLPIAAKPEGSGPLPDSLKPRCDDAIFRARDECVDTTAGPAPISRDIPLPPQIATMAGDLGRDIVLVDGEDNSVEAAAQLDRPAVFLFRLAHH